MPTPNDPARTQNRPIWVFMAATAMATTVSTLAATAMVKAESTEPISVHCTCETPAAIAIAPPLAPTVVTPSAPVHSAPPTTSLPTPSISSQPDEATVEGPLDKSIIRRIVRAHINEVRYCYNQGLTQDPELSGRVEVSFTIGTEGKITSSEVAATTFDDSDVPQCIADAVGRWMFPKPPNAESVHVTYPFVLHPD